MTDIDPKTLEHACQCAGRSVHHFDRMALDLPLRASIVAHARAIEQHEAFRQEVSEIVDQYVNGGPSNAAGEWERLKGLIDEWERLKGLIIAKTDPLVEALNDMKDGRAGETMESYAACLRTALAARGLEIREVGHD